MKKYREMPVGDKLIQVTDPYGVLPVSADLYTEAKLYNGVIAISFASIVTDGDGPPEARICARLRLTLSSAIALRKALEQALRQSMQGKGEAN